jgi:hypothetical protein
LLQKAGEKESVVMGRRIELNSGHGEKSARPKNGRPLQNQTRSRVAIL